MIRAATPEDVDQIAVLGERFLASSHYHNLIGTNPAALRDVAETLIREEHGLLLVDEFYGELAGMIGMIATIHPVSWEKVMSELFWYVEPALRAGGQSLGLGGLRLLFEAEKWGRANGIRKSIMIAPDARTGLLYQRLGYAYLETQFIKDLGQK